MYTIVEALLSTLTRLLRLLMMSMIVSLLLILVLLLHFGVVVMTFLSIYVRRGSIQVTIQLASTLDWIVSNISVT